MGYSKLEKNLIDLMKEEQAKLGYRKEAVRLYYPLSSLNHLFEAEDSVDAMQERLIHFPEDMTAKLGMLTVTHKGDRFCFRIPEEGSEYVHEHMGANEFIKELVEIVGLKHKSSISLIEAGKYEPSIEKLEKLADFFGVTMDQIVKQDLSQEVSK